MTLRVLDGMGMAPPPAPPAAGRPPNLEWLALRDLRVDSQYQRLISLRGRRTIAKIVGGFRWAKFSPVVVAPVPGAGLYSVIDGQHRATAALICGFDRVPCAIVEAAGPEQASIFAAINGVVMPVSPLALFKAGRAGGEAWALAIDRACAAAGIVAMAYPVARRDMKPWHTQSLGTLRQLHDRHGEDYLRRGLKRLRATPGMDRPGALGSPAIREACRSTRPEQALADVEAGIPVERIRAMAERGLRRSYIAAVLKQPYAVIERVLKS